MLHALSTCWVRFARAVVNMLKFISSSSSKQREITKNCRSNATAFHISVLFFCGELWRLHGSKNWNNRKVLFRTMLPFALRTGQQGILSAMKPSTSLVTLQKKG